LTTCDHPIRVGDGFSDGFEVVGRYATDTWGRCRACGGWWWCVIDDGRFGYEDQWPLPMALAEAALIAQELDAVARLLIERRLPHGPLWESSGARLALLRAMTPGADDAGRAAALAAAGATDVWTAVIRALRVDARVQIVAPEVGFDVDVRLGVAAREAYEVGDALVVLTASAELLRIERGGVVRLPLAGVPRVLATAAAGIVVEVRAEGGAGCVVIDGAGTASSGPLDGACRVDGLDEGWWLFVPDDGAARREIELRLPDGRPRVRLPRRFGAAAWMPRPRRFAEGWIVSELVTDDGSAQALTLFDDGWRTVACSEGTSGERQVTPIDAGALWASVGDTMERWVRRGGALTRELAFESRASFVVGEVLITDTRAGEVVARGRDGGERWRWRRATEGATYGVATVDGVLLYDDRWAHVLGVDGVVRERFAVEDADVRVGSAGTVDLRSGAELWRVREGARSIDVGSAAELETTAGDDAVVRRDGDGLIIGEGGVRGRFAIGDAVVIGGRGLWIVDGERVRGVLAR
jgi:hypothetical protein